MNIILSFSGRQNGNCDAIAKYAASEGDRIIYMRDLSTQPCACCSYECVVNGKCKYREDGIYSLLERFVFADKIFLVVPMYCGNPSALYFIFNERCQDYFMHNEDLCGNWADKLYVIGVYGNEKDNPEFLRVFAKQYGFMEPDKHILGLERHKYHHKMKDFLLDEAEVRAKLDRFVK